MTDSKSYRRILQASSIMGGAAGVCLLLGLVRTKGTALFIGASGVGMIANFTALQGLLNVLAGFGIQTSAVRCVAAAMANGDDRSIGESIITLRRACLITGLLGASVTAIAAPLLSEWTFGVKDHAFDIALLGIAILLANLYGGQVAIIQGTRRIGDLAWLQIVANASGTALSVVLFAWFGIGMIAPALLMTAAMQLMASWWVARRVPIPPISMSWMASLHGAARMAQMGAAVMWSALLVNLTSYLTSILIAHHTDIQSLGVYSAAYVLSGVFVNFVLNAMAADYYPRLAEVAHNKSAMQLLIGQQIEVGVLLATPGLLVMLAFAPWIVQVLYTEQFLPAVSLLQWLILGCFGRVVAWPLGFVLLALNSVRWYVFLETAFSISYFSLIAAGLKLFGLEGVAAAFPIAYALYLVAIALLVNRLIGYRWSPETARLLSRLLATLGMTFMLVRVLPPLPATIAAIGLVALASFICVRSLIDRIGAGHSLLTALQRTPYARLFGR